MKKYLVSALIAISMLLSCCFGVNATGTSLMSYDITLHSDSEGTLLIGHKNDELYTKKCYYNSKATEKRYTFNKKILAHGVYKDKIYVVYPSDVQKYVHYMAVIENGKTTDLFQFSTRNLDTGCKMTVGSDGYFYIFNRKNQIDIYNKKGELLHTTDTFANMLTIDNRCYGIQYDKVQEINHTGIIKTYTINEGFNLFNVSENYIARYGGEIYKFQGNSLEWVMNVELDPFINPCETENYIVSVKDNCLFAYDKNSGKPEASYQLEKDIFNISCYNEKITVVYKDFTAKFFSVEDIFPREKVSSTRSTNGSMEISENQIDSTPEIDDIIIIEQGTTAAQFKNLGKFSNSTVEFESNISGQLGTGTAVTINNNVHTIVVKGDVTGEGNINSRDLDALFDHILEAELLEDVYKIASDLNNDDKISNADLVMLSKITE